MSKQRMLRVLETDFMYADYQAGMSLPQIGAKWNYDYTAVWKRFRQRGFKLRTRQEGRRLRVSMVSEQEAVAS